MENPLILFYSRDGSTKLAAHYLGQKLSIPVKELKEQKVSRNFILSGYRAAAGKRRALAGNPWEEITGVSHLFLGAPIWAGNGNPVLNSFLDKADLQGKEVYLFTLQADPNKGTASKVLDFYTKRVEERGGRVAGTHALQGTSPGKRAEEDFIKQQIDTWEL